MSRSVNVWTILLAICLLPTVRLSLAAETVSKAIAKPLQAANAASKNRKWSECISNLKQADAMSGKSPYEISIINQLMAYCSNGSGDSAATARALEEGLVSGQLSDAQLATRYKQLMQLNYTTRNYSKAIDYGNRAIKAGTADGDIFTLVAQSYYLLGDYRTAQRFTSDWTTSQEKRGQRPKENMLQINLDSCMKLGDQICSTRLFEKLVVYYPKPAYWANLMRSMFRSGGGEQIKLNVYRLANEVGSMREGSDYAEMAQMAIEQGLPSEAQSVLETGFERNAFKEQREIDRTKRLLTSAKTQAVAEKMNLVKAEREAASAKTGEADIRVGQSFVSFGQYSQGIQTLKRGIAKGGLQSQGAAQITLGIALIKSGDKSAALKAFRLAKGDESTVRLAKLWSLRAQ